VLADKVPNDFSYSVLCAVVYFLLFYYPTGFNTASDRAGYHFLMVLITEVGILSRSCLGGN
jgi:hypothetical protein